MTVVIQIQGLVNGGKTPFDGQYLVEYDPERDGVSPDGEPMTAHMVTTPSVAEALTFPSMTEAWECWKQTCERVPRRADGRPNRPLTAFTVSILNAEVLAGDLGTHVMGEGEQS